MRKSRQVVEFGDFQTPDHLAQEVLSVVRWLNVSPTCIIEPTCGRGSFLDAASAVFPEARLVGLDINGDYLGDARQRLSSRPNVVLFHENFFAYDWNSFINDVGGPILILGNPPWVTNAALGVIGSENLPIKSNFQNLKGLDAITGKSNFDISEWMLLQNIEWLQIVKGTLAVLCKTAVARKILASAWKRGVPIADSRIYRIDALASFGAAVDACLLILTIDGNMARNECAVYSSLTSRDPESFMGIIDATLVANAEHYRKSEGLRGINKTYVWRSGVKHDCSRVMELTRTPEGLKNGLEEFVDIEDFYLHPLIKSSDIAGSRQISREKFVLVPQREIGEDTREIATVAPQTWAYLQNHRAALAGRTSIVYRNKPDFSIFGIGRYSFAPWKIAISGLYKKLCFRLYGSDTDKPIMFDDTVYFLPFETRDHAQNVLELLQSDMAQNFLGAMVFWDEKRPITAELLKRLDIDKLAISLGCDRQLAAHRSILSVENNGRLQSQLFA